MCLTDSEDSVGLSVVPLHKSSPEISHVVAIDEGQDKDSKTNLYIWIAP